MTTGAYADDIIMIYCARGYRSPGYRAGLVAGQAHVRGVDMIFRFARERHVVMAADARANDMIMIDVGGRYRYPCIGAVVTCFA